VIVVVTNASEFQLQRRPQVLRIARSTSNGTKDELKTGVVDAG
jgi:hypothetical protein